MGILGIGIRAVELGWVPDALIRSGIRRLCRQRIRQSLEHANTGVASEFVMSMSTGPIAPVPEKANGQHYEVPAEFFRLILGPETKYSSCFFKSVDTNLTEAERESLEITCQRAELQDGQDVLELGCGWGSLSLFMAEKYPNSRITAISNSSSQKQYIDQVCRERKIVNLKVVTADMNTFSPESSGFDRVVSVEMFEHMRNYESLLARVASWMKPNGKLFVHIFCHREYCYPFETEGDANWMGQYFFTGGIMPSQNIFQYFQRDLVVEKQFRWNGTHYQRTLDAWLQRMDSNRHQVLRLFDEIYGRRQSKVWFNRWRVFLMASSELFGFDGGNEWFVSHYLLSPAKKPAKVDGRQLDMVQV